MFQKYSAALGGLNFGFGFKNRVDNNFRYGDDMALIATKGRT